MQEGEKVGRVPRTTPEAEKTDGRTDGWKVGALSPHPARWDSRAGARSSGIPPPGRPAGRRPGSLPRRAPGSGPQIRPSGHLPMYPPASGNTTIASLVRGERRKQSVALTRMRLFFSPGRNKMRFYGRLCHLLQRLRTLCVPSPQPRRPPFLSRGRRDGLSPERSGSTFRGGTRRAYARRHRSLRRALSERSPSVWVHHPVTQIKVF